MIKLALNQSNNQGRAVSGMQEVHGTRAVLTQGRQKHLK